MSFATLQHKKESKTQTKIQTKPKHNPVTNTTPTIQRKPMCPCGGGCPGCKSIQAKLKISQPNDPLEQEADRKSYEMMNSNVNNPIKKLSPKHPSVQADPPYLTLHEATLSLN